MPRSKRKTFIGSLKKDKWLLPLINIIIIIFGGFSVFTTLVGYQYAIALYGGFWVTTLITLIFTTLAKNTMEWYTNASIGFHMWVFVILMCIFTIFFLLVPKKLKQIN